MSELRKLNIGCGHDIRSGWTNLDSSPLKGVDVVHDIESGVFPFGDEEFDEILCQDVLEHVEYIPVLKEIHRILKKGGKLTIRVPHYTSPNNYIDPTHKKRFSFRTFNFFVLDKSIGERNYYFDFHFSTINPVRIIFIKGVLFYNFIIEPLININTGVKKIYEETLLSSLFPAQNILVELIK